MDNRNVKLQVKDLTKIYEGAGGKEVLALDRVNLEVRESEFVMIVGPSGCGKTTLINIIGGLDTATEGEVLLDGTPVSGPGADRGMVFQGYSLFPWLTVQKNVEFGLKMKGISAGERADAAHKFIELVGLKGFENALPKQLSGGMKQRVAIARTLANEPQMLLMDEPFGALDAQTRAQLQEELLLTWENERKTCFFITHDVDEAVLLATKVVVMSARPGEVKEIIDIDLPYPRTQKTKLLPEFAKYKNYIWDSVYKMYLEVRK